MERISSMMSKRKASQPHEARAKMSLLVAFYEGTDTDRRGRYLSDILQWNADQLESSHNYIQVLFPLPEESGVDWAAPIIDREVFDAFRSRSELRDNLRNSFKRMLWFYGFELKTEDGVKVYKGANYGHHSSNWDNRFDHNHLRITRIIRCLRVLGLEDEALAFHAALEESTVRAGARSREYWRRAAQRSINIRPDLEARVIDGEHDLTVGMRFLREFEEGRKAKGDSDEKADETNTDDAVTGDKVNDNEIKKAEQKGKEVGVMGASDTKQAKGPEAKISIQSLASTSVLAQAERDGEKIESAA